MPQRSISQSMTCAICGPCAHAGGEAPRFSDVQARDDLAMASHGSSPPCSPEFSAVGLLWQC